MKGKLQKTRPVNPVLCVDKNCQATDDQAEITGCVRVKPDDWPSCAESAWARTEDVLDQPKLMAAIIKMDRDRLENIADIVRESIDASVTPGFSFESVLTELIQMQKIARTFMDGV